VSSLPKTVTRQRRDCDLNPGPSAPESSTLTTRLPSHPIYRNDSVPTITTTSRAHTPQPADVCLVSSETPQLLSPLCLHRGMPGSTSTRTPIHNSMGRPYVACCCCCLYVRHSKTAHGARASRGFSAKITPS